MAVNNSHLRGTSEGGLVEKFVDVARPFFNRAADQIDFFSPAGAAEGLRSHR